MAAGDDVTLVRNESMLAAPLEDRGFVELRGPDARALLQGLVSNDVEQLGPERAVFTALLTAQGRYLFDFIMIDLGCAILLDCERERAAALAQRLLLYRLRAAVEIVDVSDRWSVTALFGAVVDPELPDGKVEVRGDARLVVDPRSAVLGTRLIAPRGAAIDLGGATTVDPARFRRHRIAQGVPCLLYTSRCV